MKYSLALLLLFLLSCSKKDDLDNSINNRNILKKITIREGVDLNSIITVYTLNYNSDSDLTELAVSRQIGSQIRNANYSIEYNSEGEITRALLDCSTSDCGWNFGILPSNFVEVAFERTSTNGKKTIAISENELDANQDLVGWIAGVEYIVDSNNYITKQNNTDILYKDGNIVGINNSFSFNDGLEYFDYDGKTGVVAYTDHVGVINKQEYIYRLILGLRFSKNNHRRMKFDFKSEDHYITIEYDDKNRPITRTVTDKYNEGNQLLHQEIFEYVD